MDLKKEALAKVRSSIYLKKSFIEMPFYLRVNWKVICCNCLNSLAQLQQRRQLKEKDLKMEMAVQIMLPECINSWRESLLRYLKSTESVKKKKIYQLDGSLIISACLTTSVSSILTRKEAKSKRKSNKFGKTLA